MAVRSQSTKKLFSDFTHEAKEPSISHLEFTSFFNVRERCYIYPVMCNLRRFVLLLNYYNKIVILKFVFQKSKENVNFLKNSFEIKEERGLSASVSSEVELTLWILFYHLIMLTGGKINVWSRILWKGRALN